MNNTREASLGPAAADSPLELRPVGPRSGGWLVRLAVTVALYGIIFYEIDAGSVLSRLATTQVAFVVAGALTYAVGQLLSAYRWHLLTAAGGLTVSYARLATFYFAGMFFNHLLPTIVGGDAIKVILLARETGSPVRATASVFMERNLGLLALLLVSLVAARMAPPMTLFGLSLPALTSLLLGAYLAVNVLLLTPSAYRFVDRIIQRTPLARFRPRAVSVYDAFMPYTRTPVVIGWTLVLSLVFQILVIVVVFLNTRALGQHVPLAALSALVPLISLAGMIPVSINGLGVRDALYLLFFSQLGLSPDVSLSLAFLYLAVTIAASLPGGLLYTTLKKPARSATSSPASWSDR